MLILSKVSSITPSHVPCCCRSHSRNKKPVTRNWLLRGFRSSASYGTDWAWHRIQHRSTVSISHLLVGKHARKIRDDLSLVFVPMRESERIRVCLRESCTRENVLPDYGARCYTHSYTLGPVINPQKCMPPAVREHKPIRNTHTHTHPARRHTSGASVAKTNLRLGKRQSLRVVSVPAAFVGRDIGQRCGRSSLFQ